MTLGRLNDGRTYFTMLLPALILLVILTFIPFVYTLYLSVHSWTLIQPGGPKFVGVANFGRLFNDAAFWGSVRTTLLIFLIGTSVQLLIGFSVALLLDRQTFWASLAKSLLLLPMTIPPIVAALMWQIMLHGEFGLFNYILRSVGIANPPIWLGQPTTALATIVLVDTWQWTPFVMLLSLAGLQKIPPAYYEVAAVEGANWFHQLRYLVLPSMRYFFLVIILVRGVDILKLFDIIYVLTKGGPLRATETVSYFIYRRAFAFFDMGYAAAGSVVVLILIILLSTCFMKLLQREDRT